MEKPGIDEIIDEFASKGTENAVAINMCYLNKKGWIYWCFDRNVSVECR